MSLFRIGIMAVVLAPLIGSPPPCDPWGYLVAHAQAGEMEGRAVTLTVFPNRVLLNGTAQIVAFVSDAGGPVAGQRVDFQVVWTNCGAALQTDDADTNASGVATVTLQAGDSSGYAQVSATPEEWTQKARAVIEIVAPDPVQIEYRGVKWETGDTGSTITGTVRVTHTSGPKLTLIEVSPPLVDVPGASVVRWDLPHELDIFEAGQWTEAPFEFRLPAGPQVFQCYVMIATSDWAGRRRGHDRAYVESADTFASGSAE